MGPPARGPHGAARLSPGESQLRGCSAFSPSLTSHSSLCCQASEQLYFSHYSFIFTQIMPKNYLNTQVLLYSGKPRMGKCMNYGPLATPTHARFTLFLMVYTKRSLELKHCIVHTYLEEMLMCESAPESAHMPQATRRHCVCCCVGYENRKVRELHLPRVCN